MSKELILEKLEEVAEISTKCEYHLISSMLYAIMGSIVGGDEEKLAKTISDKVASILKEKIKNKEL